MSILTKPSVSKGVPAQFSLNKANLLLHPMVQASSYFSDQTNWYRVNVIYKSSVGTQYEIVEFDASQESPTGTFLVSERARDVFQVQRVQILDFDGGFLEIPRSELESEEWDVSMSLGAMFDVTKVDSSRITISNNNRTARLTTGSSTYKYQAYITPSFSAASGKKYIEFTVDATTSTNPITVGGRISNSSPASFQEISAYDFGSGGFTFKNTGDGFVFTTYHPSVTFGAGDRLMMAIDLDNKKIWFGKNGAWYLSDNPLTNTGGVSISSLSGSDVYLGVSFGVGSLNSQFTIVESPLYLPTGYDKV